MLTNQFPKLQNQAKYLVKSVIPCNKAMIVFVASIFHGHICEIKIVSTKSFQFLKVGCSKSNPFTLAKNPGMPYVSITLNVATSMNALRTVWNYPDEYKNVIHLGCFKFFQRKFPNKLNHLEREREREMPRRRHWKSCAILVVLYWTWSLKSTYGLYGCAKNWFRHVKWLEKASTCVLCNEQNFRCKVSVFLFFFIMVNTS